MRAARTSRYGRRSRFYPPPRTCSALILEYRTVESGNSLPASSPHLHLSADPREGNQDILMVTEVKPLAEITQAAIQLLCRELGVVSTARFLNQFSVGYGNYTAERDQLFGHLTVENIAQEIKAKRDQAGKS